MKRAEDFRSAFGQADTGFENAVRHTLQELRSEEERRPVFRRPRVLVPAIAALLILMLGIGIAASGRWGVQDWLKENRAPGTGEIPAADETAGPFAAPVESDRMTVTVREARSDGYGIYLSVLFTPKEKGALVLNRAVNPFSEGPEALGIEPDEEGQTLAKWAVAHGYHKLIRISLHSRHTDEPESWKDNDEAAAWLTEHGIPFRRDKSGNLEFDQVYMGADVESYVNNRMMLEEDGSTMIMAAGGYQDGQEEYAIGWSAVPYRMDENGSGSWDRCETDEADQGTVSLRIPEEDGKAITLAEYAGEAPSKENPEERIPVTVQMIRTELNDYCRIRTADTARAFMAPRLYLVEDQVRPTEHFAQSEIYAYSAQRTGGMLVYTFGCRLPEELPDRLAVVWFDSAEMKAPETTPVERTGR